MNNLNFKRFVSKRLSETRFSCVNCGKCCKNRGIELNDKEIQSIAIFLNIDLEEFKQDYIEKREIDRIKTSIHHDYHIKKEACFLKIQREDGICIFNEKINNLSRCKIYKIRPNVCRLFPFTWEYVHENQSLNIDFSENSWNNCDGVSNKTGRTWTEIREEVTSIVIASLLNALESGGIKKI